MGSRFKILKMHSWTTANIKAWAWMMASMIAICNREPD
ncbi:hypothetical protein SynMVIR181_02247 [Synechococcus sp. MVIR-18-1]|nr:hypothetical protein SynMVIR181_02247 [Synechococcus sp. MVIR-18-1]